MKEHYYSETQSSKERVNHFKETMLGKTLEFETVSGIFSPKKIDKGSEVLIKNCLIKDGQRVLDLGCSYGAVGLTIAKVYDVKVVMTDINKRAIRVARKNMKLNNLDNVQVTQGNGFEKVDGKFDVILFNPPQSAGKELCESLIREAKDFLNENGTLQVVARKNKGGKSLSEFMEKTFGNLEVLGKSAGYWVYMSVNYHME